MNELNFWGLTTDRNADLGEVQDALAEMLNRVEDAKFVLSKFHHPVFVGTKAMEFASEVEHVLAGEPDGAGQ